METQYDLQNMDVEVHLFLNGATALQQIVHPLNKVSKAVHQLILPRLTWPLKGPKFQLTGIRPCMESCQITSLANFQSKTRDGVVDIEIQSEGAADSRCFRLTYQIKDAFWTPQYKLDLHRAGEVTLNLDPKGVLEHWGALRLVKIYHSLVDFGTFEEYRQDLRQHEPEIGRDTRARPLLVIQRHWRDLTLPQSLEVNQLRFCASSMVILLRRSGSRSLPHGWMEVYAARLVTAAGSKEITNVISNYSGSNCPAPESPTSPNTSEPSNGDRQSHSLPGTMSHTAEEYCVANVLAGLKDGTAPSTV